MRLNFETTGKIRDIIQNIDRTEDIKFSPDGTKFIIVDFLESKLHLFSYQMNQKGSGRTVEITRYCLINSPQIKDPHGVSFLDNDKIVVSNRAGGVTIFKMPDLVDEVSEFELQPEKSISEKGLFTANVTTPSSVHTVPLADDTYRIYVCNNLRHTISTHVITVKDDISIKNEGILIENSLRFPDGLSVSPDRQWVAISNHDYGQVVIFKNEPGLNKKTAPSVVMKGPVCPHGIRFSEDGGKLYVSDAATQYLFIYRSEDGKWDKAEDSVQTVKVVDDEAFYLGKTGFNEGGVKGIDLDESNGLFAMTHRMDVLCFYDLTELDTTQDVPDWDEIKVITKLRDSTKKATSDSLVFRYWPQGMRLIRNIRSIQYLYPGYYRTKLRNARILSRLANQNKKSEASLTDPSGPVLSLSSHEKNVETIYYTLESIRQGTVKPSKVILWIDQEQKDDLPETLKRLQKAGLEIRDTGGFGPHDKYYLYVCQNDVFDKPLVTADAGTIYPSDWLEEMVQSYNSDPSSIHCYRAFKIRLLEDKFIPMRHWKRSGLNTASHLNFISGDSGVIYPPEFLEYLKTAGDEFLEYCPTADDVWLTVNALRADIKITQIQKRPKDFMTTPGSKNDRSNRITKIKKGNHYQLLKTFGDEDIRKLQALMKDQPEPVHA